MKKAPGWYDDAVAHHAKEIREEAKTRDQAMASLRELVRDDHPEFGNAILDEWNAPRLAAAVTAERSQYAVTESPASDPEWDLHRTLFADLPYRSLRITPARYQQVCRMTAHDLDMARNVLLAKTGNAIRGAEEERRQFEAFYGAVRPLLSGDATVADAERRIAAQASVPLPF